MRTTLDISEELLAKVVKFTGEKKKSRAVEKALREYLSWKAVEGLRALAGKIDLVNNLKELEELELQEQKEGSWSSLIATSG